VKEIKEADELVVELSNWQGARAKLWEYHVSLQQLMIQLERNAGKSNLIIVCSPCIRINAPVFWEVHDIRLESVSKKKDIGLIVYYLIDQEAGVEIRCAGISAKRDVPPFFNKNK
jgi:hypothetical protein